MYRSNAPLSEMVVTDVSFCTLLYTWYCSLFKDVICVSNSVCHINNESYRNKRRLYKKKISQEWTGLYIIPWQAIYSSIFFDKFLTDRHIAEKTELLLSEEYFFSIRAIDGFVTYVRPYFE